MIIEKARHIRTICVLASTRAQYRNVPGPPLDEFNVGESLMGEDETTRHIDRYVLFIAPDEPQDLTRYDEVVDLRAGYQTRQPRVIGKGEYAQWTDWEPVTAKSLVTELQTLFDTVTPGGFRPVAIESVLTSGEVSRQWRRAE